MVFDDLRDFMDQDIPAGQIPTGSTGPIAQVLAGMPDWMNMPVTPDDLNKALENLPVPLEGPFPPGISGYTGKSKA